MGSVLAGSLLCVGGSWGSNMANVSLKQLDNANDKLEKEEKPRLPWANYYNYKYVGCYVLSQCQDQTSLLLISQTLWAAISCLDVFWYSLFMCIYVGDPLEPLEMIPLSLIIIGIGFTVFSGAEEVEKIKPGYARITEDSDRATVLAVVPAFCVLLVLAYLFVYYEYRMVKADPVTYPPGYMPPPLSFYNCAGIFINGASTGLFATSMFVLNNSGLYENCMFDPENCDYPDCWWATLIVGFCIFLPLTALSFMTDWFAAEELHIITVVPASLIVSTLVQFMLTKTFYGDEYTNPPIFYLGVSLMVLALVAYVFVEQHIFDRDAQDSEENLESKNLRRFDWWFQWMEYCPCEYRIHHAHLVKKSDIESKSLKDGVELQEPQDLAQKIEINENKEESV